MRVLVCGGREFDDWALLNKTLLEVYVMNQMESMVIIEGEAKGADFLARVWAKWKDSQCREEGTITSEPYLADWKKYGYKAGSIRNQQMLDEGKPDIVVAFPGGGGTADMIKRAKKAGVEVMEVRE